jgi:hypothetical protein
MLSAVISVISVPVAEIQDVQKHLGIHTVIQIGTIAYLPHKMAVILM